MNKLLICSLLTSILLISGCDVFKKKSESEENATDQQMLADWSCTADANINQIQRYLKEEYLKALDKSLRHSNFQADQAILEKIKKGIKFEIKGITTLTEDTKNSKALECSSQLIVHLPKGLQQRAENAFLELPCEECEYEHHEGKGPYTLQDSLENREYALELEGDKIRGHLSYNITKTDKDGLSLSIPSQIAVLDGVVEVSKYASEYEAYVTENKERQKNSKQYEEQEMAQMSLAQKAIDIRKKELDAENASVVERLNQTWDSLNEEQQAKLKSEQAEWFEKRDVDCKVLSQKSVYSLSEHEKETYQKHSQYWNEDMKSQNQQMQYTKCFNQKTVERIHYLNNFND